MLLALLASLGLYLAFWPVPIAPEAWTPPPSPPLTGALALNDRLANGTRIAPALHGPEAVAFDAQGRILTGLLDGRIVRIEGDRVLPVAVTGGRPLGIELDAQGRMIVADAYRGLLRVDASGRVETLATTHGGRPFRFADDLDIAADGTIYFSDASSRWPLSEYRLDILEHRPHGRLLAYHPDTNEVELIADGLYFANGVQLTPDESAVIVCETSSYRLLRVSLTEGERGRVSTFADGLPGFCDNVRYAPERGVYWVAIGSPRNRLLDRYAGSPAVRRLIARLPSFMQPSPVAHAMVIAVGEDGRVKQSLHHVGEGAYAPIASVVEREGHLYLGSFREDGLYRVRVR